MTTEERIQEEVEELLTKVRISSASLDVRRDINIRLGYEKGATAEAARNKENAIAFAEWLFNNGWKYDGGGFFNKPMTKQESIDLKMHHKDPYFRASTDQLYDLFIEQNKT